MFWIFRTDRCFALIRSGLPQEGDGGRAAGRYLDWRERRWRAGRHRHDLDGREFGDAMLTDGTIASVSCFASTACTAVGSDTNPSGIDVTLAERWNGTDWQQQATPNPVGDTTSSVAPSLVGVSCPTAGFCVAVGNYGSGFNQAGAGRGLEWGRLAGSARGHAGRRHLQRARRGLLRLRAILRSDRGRFNCRPRSDVERDVVDAPVATRDRRCRGTVGVLRELQLLPVGGCLRGRGQRGRPAGGGVEWHLVDRSRRRGPS
jgi:hypothetical protein